MTSFDASAVATTGPNPRAAGSLTEDYVGLARYLAEAIARGAVPFDEATVELGAAAHGTERASLHRAADVARERADGSLVERLLAGAKDDRRAQ